MKKEKVADKIKNNGAFAGFAHVARQFFPGFAEWLDEMDDPRHASYIKHSQGVLCGSPVMKDVFGLESMQAMDKTFMTDGTGGLCLPLWRRQGRRGAPLPNGRQPAQGRRPRRAAGVPVKCAKVPIVGKLSNDARVDGERLVILGASGYARCPRRSLSLATGWPYQ